MRMICRLVVRKRVHPSILYVVAGIQVSEAVKIITGQTPTLVSNLLYIDLNNLSFDKIQMFRQKECKSCGLKKKINDEPIVKQELIIEELCGRDRGKRTYSVTPSGQSLSVNLNEIIRNAELLGYSIKTKGSMGITAISKDIGKLSVSFLMSGSATIVGANDEKDALSIYKTFVKSV